MLLSLVDRERCLWAEAHCEACCLLCRPVLLCNFVMATKECECGNEGSSKCILGAQEEAEASHFVGSQEEQGQGEGCKVGSKAGGRPNSVTPPPPPGIWVYGWVNQNPGKGSLKPPPPREH